MIEIEIVLKYDIYTRVGLFFSNFSKSNLIIQICTQIVFQKS